MIDNQIATSVGPLNVKIWPVEGDRAQVARFFQEFRTYLKGRGMVPPETQKRGALESVKSPVSRVEFKSLRWGASDRYVVGGGGGGKADNHDDGLDAVAGCLANEPVRLPRVEKVALFEDWRGQNGGFSADSRFSP